MSELKAKEYKQFEDIRHVDEEGREYWLARELSDVLEYTKWANFTKVIDKAKIAALNSGYDPLDNFADVGKIVPTGVSTKKIKDYRLSRYACYLIVQNGDPRKEVIALGQTYFAIQTYRQEVADTFNTLDEDAKRLVVRGSVKQWNQLLAEAARNAGVITNEEFAVFQNSGYMGLYGGLGVADIHKKKALGVRDKILDFMGSAELVANLFRITQAEEIMRRDEVDNPADARTVHFNVGRAVRGAIAEAGGTMPEDLPTPKRSISQIEREQLAKLKEMAKKGELMLDE